MLDKLVLITGSDCQKCNWLKKKIAKEELGNDMIILDKDDKETLGQLAYHEMLEKMPLNLPILIYDEETFLAGESMKSLKIIREHNVELENKRKVYKNIGDKGY